LVLYIFPKVVQTK